MRDEWLVRLLARLCAVASVLGSLRLNVASPSAIGESLDTVVSMHAAAAAAEHLMLSFDPQTNRKLIMKF